MSTLLAASWTIRQQSDPDRAFSRAEMGEAHARWSLERSTPRTPSAAEVALSSTSLDTATSAARRPDPLRVRLCPGVTLTTVSDFGDPDVSLVTLRSPDDPSSRARRLRGSVGSLRIVYIGDNPIARRPAVWLSDGPSLCQVVLGLAPPTETQSRSAQAGKGGIAPSSDGATSTSPMSQMARFVERIDSSTFRVDRALVDLAVGGGAELTPALRGVNGRLGAQGFSLSRVPAASLPALLGLGAGDNIVAIGDHPLSGLEAIALAHAEIARSPRVTLTVLHGGVRRQLVYEVN